MHTNGHHTAPPSRHGLARSAAMQDALRGLAAAIAGSGGVLLCGEPGSGRELFARAIHAASGAAYSGGIEDLLRRSMRPLANGRPFVTIDCADRESLEQRLFGTPRGHELPGDALERIKEGSALHAGLGGTLLLRQVPEMPPRLQQRLARILRDGEAWLERHTGSAALTQVALRPMGTAERTEGETLAPELHKRMTHAVIALPPLRARREDIPGLVRCLIADICGAVPTDGKTVSRQAVDLLAALPWRGNVTELETLLRTLVHRVPGRQIRLADVLAHVRLDGHVTTSMYSGTLKEARERFEREYVAAVLEQHRGRMAEAARALGLQRTNLYRKVRQLSVRRLAGRPVL